MSDEETKTRKPRGPSADKLAEGMNLEALHDKIELWGIAGVAAQLMARGMAGDSLARGVASALDAARQVKGKLG